MQAKGRMSIAAGMPGSEGITAKIIRLDTENRSIMTAVHCESDPWMF